MSELKIIQIKETDIDFLSQVQKQFAAMYVHMKDKGLKLQLADEGEKKWIISIKKTLGRFSALFVVLDDKKVAGFVFGIIKFTPDYLGSKKIGSLTHQYLDPDYRGKGLGDKLLKALEKWFEEKNVSSVEVQANIYNAESRKYFEKNAYENELVQLRKFLKK